MSSDLKASRRLLLPGPLGVSVEMHVSGTGSPPDRKVGPAQPSAWLRLAGGPSGWWRLERKCQHKAWAQVEEAESVVDVLLLCDQWWPAVEATDDPR